MKIAIAPTIRGTTVCHATTEEIPFPIFMSLRWREAVPRGTSFPLLRYDLLVEKDKPEFLRADGEERRNRFGAVAAPGVSVRSRALPVRP
jgi:hypothetical protein